MGKLYSYTVEIPNLVELGELLLGFGKGKEIVISLTYERTIVLFFMALA